MVRANHDPRDIPTVPSVVTKTRTDDAGRAIHRRLEIHRKRSKSFHQCEASQCHHAQEKSHLHHIAYGCLVIYSLQYRVDQHFSLISFYHFTNATGTYQ